MDEITKNSKLTEAISLRKIIKSKVIAKNGKIIGKVVDFMINKETFEVQGIIARKWFKKYYIGLEYISNISEESILLTIDPYFIYKNKKVINFEGKQLGKISKINRKNNSNDIESIKVKSLFKKEATILYSDIKSFGESLILKEQYGK